LSSIIYIEQAYVSLKTLWTRSDKTERCKLWYFCTISYRSSL